jgi:hypothetical protein
MGTLVHGYGSTAYEIDDRTLSHIKVMVSLKLDRGHSFFLSWERPSEQGSGRVSLWISASTPLQFRFKKSRRPEITRRWIEYMMANSYGPRGLIVVDEESADMTHPLPPGLL